MKLLKDNVAVLVSVLFLAPVLLGTFTALLPAFGYLPVLGYQNFSLDAWRLLFETPALWQMLSITLVSGVGATLVSLLLALTFVSAAWGSRSWQTAERWLSPILATPHVALAVGFAFLVMPSGILFRLLAPAAGWTFPPDWQTTQDPWGISLMVLLVLKETPFLVLMLMSAVSQVPVRTTLRTGASLGYQPWSVWVKLIWPQLYPQIRLSVYTVLAFSLSVVDIAVILGPTAPPTFALQVLEWLQDPDLTRQLPAAAGSILLMAVVAAAIVLAYLVEKLAPFFLRRWVSNGRRGQAGRLWSGLSLSGWNGLLMLFLSSALLLVVWSFAWRWRFPSLWPQSWSFRSWERAWPAMVEPLCNSLLIGMASALLGLLLTILILETRDRLTVQARRRISAAMYLPLILPQLTFLSGIQFWLISAQAEGHWLSVVFMHLLFVFPYCYLSLSGPWEHFDQRQTLQAKLLSGSSWRAFLQIKVPMLLRPALASLALGFAVSIAQYLPTLFAGAGRVSTVTTETVALASSGNRRLIGVYALVQMLLPMVVYLLALSAGRWRIYQGRLKRRWV